MGKFLAIYTSKIDVFIRAVTFEAVCVGEHVSGSHYDRCGNLCRCTLVGVRVDVSSGGLYWRNLL
jgi:hypothetical protein